MGLMSVSQMERLLIFDDAFKISCAMPQNRQTFSVLLKSYPFLGKCGSCELKVNGKTKIRPCIGKVPASATPIKLDNL